MTDIAFDKVEPTDEQIDTLYELLSARQHSISHHVLPTLDAHSEFVKSNPYRAWYLVTFGEKSYGAFYISHENTIGINIAGMHVDEVVGEIISFVSNNYEPLPEIKSVRGGTFTINVSPDNEHLLNALEKLNKKVLQISYSLD